MRRVSFSRVRRLLAFSVLVLAACSPGAPADEPLAGDPAAGQHAYALYCASCHGARGDATGPLASSLRTRPADHTAGAYMNTVSDEYLFAVIADGGAAVGKSTEMAAWGGTLADAQIRDLIAFIRSLADPPYAPED